MAEHFNPFSEIRKESLDIYNRLHSIDEDVSFVNGVHEAYRGLPLVPNLRCGAWYTDPSRATDVPAYFKSTDGHFGNWGFNLRRSNLHLISVVIENSGIVFVDSTRSGKRIPDALSKTIPIWCSVINRSMLKRYPEVDQKEWDTSLYTPPTSVSSQENDQISRRLDEWADALASSSFDLPKLPCPLRPFWITPATSSFPKFDKGADQRKYLPVICVSASKQVHDGAERRTSGFSYIQGSGDDHELWGMGLTPQIFWSHKDRLLSTPRADLPDIVSTLISSSTSKSSSSLISPASHSGKVPEGVLKVSNRILLSTLTDVEPTLSTPPPLTAYVLVDEVDLPGPSADSTIPPTSPSETQESPVGPTPEPLSSSSTLKFEIPGGKKSQTFFLHHVLPTALPFIDSKLSSGHNVVVACPSAKDLSVGVALGAIARYFDHNGVYVGSKAAMPDLSKQTIRTRLEWIIASCPRANPSRTTLKRVNEFLLTAEHLRR
ncbi:hypothetical protein D9611_003701 [Ephemerocybe angulata]|uniref:Initiator tRNA phosphoribosyl transferase n=1 Tax=Ephemerocybe angulata TaxID=980116 RepID=A0A8H5EYT5_9AGAR|nr:hypothetical protein D9611_003701 [Tulosesus angulatus]